MLELLERILSKIDDNTVLSTLSETDAPVYTLQQCYLALQSEGVDLPAYAEDALAKDLKNIVRGLPNDIQSKLLDRYLETTHENKESIVDIEGKEDGIVEIIWKDAPLRRWLVKATAFFVFFILTLAIGVGFATAYFTGNITDGVFTNTVMNTGLEIFKLIFTAK